VDKTSDPLDLDKDKDSDPADTTSLRTTSMRPDDIGGDSPTQTLHGNARRFLRPDGTPMAAVEGDGVVSLHKLGLVPTARWRHGLMLKLPDWAIDTDDPGAQFLAILVELPGQRRDDVAELREIRIRLKTALTLIQGATDLPAVTTRLESALQRVNALSMALDLP
jgi:hypothetical protein